MWAGVLSNLRIVIEKHNTLFFVTHFFRCIATVFPLSVVTGGYPFR
jgi:hypothetical protein